MDLYRISTKHLAGPTRTGDYCEIVHEGPFSSPADARVAAGAVLSVLDYAYGAGTHGVAVHRKRARSGGFDPAPLCQVATAVSRGEAAT